MRSITWLASYPRSGNTFVRALLANYDSGLDRPLTTQEIAHYQFGEHDEALLTRWSGHGAGQRTIEQEWAARPDYFAAIRASAGEGPALVKTHTLNGSVFGRPAFEILSGDRIVYILRHPLDVAVSGAAFFQLDQAAMAERMLLPGATNKSGDAFWEVTGSWQEHVAGWLGETKAPVLLIRFEALCAAPRYQLSRVLTFLGRKVEHRRLKRAVERAAFPILQASQRSEGFDQGPGRDTRATFFRNGRTGEWKQALAGDLTVDLSKGLGEAMDRLGYERAAPTPSMNRVSLEPAAVAVQREA